MSYEIYRLNSGKISRVDETGIRRTFQKGYEFVPTASELAANKDRLVLVGIAEDDDKKVVAFKNNGGVHQDIKAAVAAAGQRKSSVDIGMLDDASALGLIEAAEDTGRLAEYLTQETAVTRGRPKILKAIKDRRAEILKTKEVVAQGGNTSE